MTASPWVTRAAERPLPPKSFDAYAPAAPRCPVRGRDWAGRLMFCIREERHAGSHVGSLGGRLRVE